MFLVDLPVLGDSWDNVAEFETRQEAIDFCKENFGSDNEGRVNLICEINEEDEEFGGEDGASGDDE